MGNQRGLSTESPIEVERTDDAETGGFVFQGSGPGFIVGVNTHPEVTVSRICGTETLDGSFDSVQFTYRLAKVGKGRNKSCQARFSWDFDECEDQSGNREHINMSSPWITISTDPNGGPFGDCSADASVIDVIDTTDFTFTVVVNDDPQPDLQQSPMEFWLTRSPL